MSIIFIFKFIGLNIKMDDTVYDIVAEILRVPKGSFEIKDIYKDLVLAHYNDQEVGKYVKNEDVWSVRGTIVNIKTKNIACSSFGYIPTVVTNDTKFLEKNSSLKDEDGNTYKMKEFYSVNDALGYWRETGEKTFDIMPLYEGTMIRVWSYGSEVMYSTYKKINAYDSKFGSSRKFGEILDECLKGYDIRTIIQKYKLVMYFVLMNKDLLHASKFPIAVGDDKRDGVAVFIGNRTKDNHSPGDDFAWWFNGYKLDYLDYDNYVNNPEQRLFISKFLYDNEIEDIMTMGYNPLKIRDDGSFNSFGEGLTISYEVDGFRKHIQIVPSNYKYRNDMFYNDPNILHGAFDFLTIAQYPNRYNGKSEDDYGYAPVNIIPDDAIELAYSENTPFIDVSKYPVYELNDENKNYSEYKRFRNAMMYYAMALPLYKQLDALYYIKQVIDMRDNLTITVIKNKDKILKGKNVMVGNTKPFTKKALEFLRKNLEYITRKYIGNEAKINSAIGEEIKSFKGSYVYQLCVIFDIRGIENPVTKKEAKKYKIKLDVPHIDYQIYSTKDFTL